MEQSAIHDLKIFGVGRASGGEFNEVLITGQGDVEGNIVCAKFSLNGEGTVNGSVKTGEGSILGTSTINGALDADRCKIVGTVRIGGNATDVTSTTDSLMTGGSFQGTVNDDVFGLTNQFIAGTSLDFAHVYFRNETNIGSFDSQAVVIPSGMSHSVQAFTFAWARRLPA